MITMAAGESVNWVIKDVLFVDGLLSACFISVARRAVATRIRAASLCHCCLKFLLLVFSHPAILRWHPSPKIGEGVCTSIDYNDLYLE